jgi:hypothetical protein
MTNPQGVDTDLLLRSLTDEPNTIVKQITVRQIARGPGDFLGRVSTYAYITLNLINRLAELNIGYTGFIHHIIFRAIRMQKRLKKSPNWPELQDLQIYKLDFEKDSDGNIHDNICVYSNIKQIELNSPIATDTHICESYVVKRSGMIFCSITTGDDEKPTEPEEKIFAQFSSAHIEISSIMAIPTFARYRGRIFGLFPEDFFSEVEVAKQT